MHTTHSAESVNGRQIEKPSVDALTSNVLPDETLSALLCSLCSLCSITLPLSVLASTIPKSTEDADSCLFQLIRHLRAIPEISALDPVTLKPVIRKWHELSRLEVDFELGTWEVFTFSWDRVKCVHGESAVDLAIRLVDSGDLPIQSGDYGPALGRLVGMCWHLAGRSGRFFLSVHDAARALLGPEHRGDPKRVDSARMLASRALRRLGREEVICVVVRRGWMRWRLGGEPF